MSESLLQSALHKKNKSRPPVWFMRQAGRYHSHYQRLRKEHSFMDLCKNPELACEVTLGPIHDFDFDAAILFSDLLFPLEAMGMGLKYEEGPKLAWHLSKLSDLNKLQKGIASHMSFQGEALTLLKKRLSPEKALIGFVGAPFTLFCYAALGSHRGQLNSAVLGLRDGRYDGFVEKLFDCLLGNMVLQAQSGADTIALFDTCAGALSPSEYGDKIIPTLQLLLFSFKSQCPNTPVIYYSKDTDPRHWSYLKKLPIDCLGIDWKQDLSQTLSEWSAQLSIQGNTDPEWLFLNPPELEKKLRLFFLNIKALPSSQRNAWVCGLGHGVLPGTPVNNVRLFLKLQREIFS